MHPDLTAARPTLVHLTKTDPDPRVRHRAHLLLDIIRSPSMAAAGRVSGTSPTALGTWRDRFLADGRGGLVDRPRRGRPSRVDAAADQLLHEALAASPMDYGYPVALWGLVDLADLLARRQAIQIGTEALSRHLKKLGYVYRRPRHDLHERQNEDAIASARHTLQKLQKRGLIAPDTASCTWMNAISTPIPSWQRCGSDAAAGRDQRSSIFGALDYGSGTLTTQITRRASAHEFGHFLTTLAGRWPSDQLVLVMDNAAYHKTAAIRRWFADHAERITVLWLPTYSLHLNLIERVWRFVKGKLACHRHWNDRPGLIHVANRLLHLVEARFAAPTWPHLTLRETP